MCGKRRAGDPCGKDGRGESVRPAFPSAEAHLGLPAYPEPDSTQPPGREKTDCSTDRLFSTTIEKAAKRCSDLRSSKATTAIPLPLAVEFPDDRVGRGSKGRSRDGVEARRLLYGLLLGFDGAAVRRRGHESIVDCRVDGFRITGKGRAGRCADWESGGVGVSGFWRVGGFGWGLKLGGL